MARELVSLGPGVQMTKADTKAACRLIPVHPNDCPLLTVHWKGETFCGTMLSFSLALSSEDF